jgi:carboxymethylenebutenolidase
MNKEITIGGSPAYLSFPEEGIKYPGLIVIHEIWGLEDHIKDVADRFAKQGYAVIAPNLFHDTAFEGKIDQKILDDMHNPQTRDEAQKKMRDLMAPIMSPAFAERALVRLKQCVDYLLADKKTNNNIAVIGFCFGGTYSFHLAAKDSRIKAAVPLYGRPPAENEIPDINCPVLAFYGEEDKNLMDTLPQLKVNMKKHNKNFEAVVYENTGHAFFNNTNPRMYREFAAKNAWERILVFLKSNLK